MAKYVCIFVQILIIGTLCKNSKQTIHEENEIRSITLKSHSSNIFIENLVNEAKFQTTKSVNDEKSFNFIIKRKSGIFLNISFTDIEALNQYEDIDHISENRIVLESDLSSDMHYLKKPLKHIINSYCRHPLPSSYFITMDSFENRLTAPEINFCTSEKLNLIECMTNFKPGRQARRRSINKPCLKQIGGARLVYKEKSPLLPMEINSIYCTENTPIVKLFLHEPLKDSIEFYQDSKCEMFYNQCNQCFRIFCQISFLSNARINCPNALKCLMEFPCINFYSSSCNENNKVCLKGTTLKFSLTPEFQLTNNTFQCHLKRILLADNSVARISIAVHVPKMPDPIILSTNLLTFLDEQIVSKSFGGLDIKYKKRLNLNNEIILYVDNNSMNVAPITQLMSAHGNQFNLYMHQKQKYIKVKMSQPFIYNSQTWSNESCDIDVSKLEDVQDSINNKQLQKIQLKNRENFPQKTNDGKYLYKFTSNAHLDIIEINLMQQTSILHSVFCKDRNTSGSLTGIEVDITHIAHNQVLLKITGYATHLLTYLNLTLYKNYIVFQHLDILIYELSENLQNKTRFWLEFQIKLYDNQKYTKFPLTLNLHLSDCFKTLIRYINLNLKLISNRSMNNINSTLIFQFPNQMDLIEISKHVKLIGWIALISIFVLISILCLLCFIRSFRNSNLNFSPKEKSINSKITLKNKSFIIIYILLRITYSFLFTFTTILSLILTIRHEHNFEKIGPKNLSTYSTDNSYLVNQSSLMNCSNNLKFNLNHYLERFQKKRTENNEIFYNSRQSIQNETLTVTSIFHQRLKQITDNQRHSMADLLILNGNLYKRFYSKYFDQIIDSNWLNQLMEISNNSKDLYGKHFHSWIWKNDIDFSFEKIRFSELINISELLFTIQSIKLLETKFMFFNEIQSNLIKIPKVKIPHFFINRTSSYRYMERIFINIPRRKKSRKEMDLSHFNLFITSKSKVPKAISNIFSLRIFMMLIDLMIIAHRSYKLFTDVEQFLKGRKSFLQYKCSPRYSSFPKKDSFIVDESSFKQLTTKVAPWTKRQNFYCFNSFDVIIIIQFVILSVICIGLLIGLASRESSIFLMPLIHSNTHSNSWWFLSFKIKVFQMKHQTPIAQQWNENAFPMWKQIMSLRQNLTFVFNNNERNIISQYMWEQCFSERNYPIISLWNQKEFYHKINSAGYCQMPLPQISIEHKSINCDFQKSNLLFYYYYIRRRRFKDRPYFIHIFRLYIVELSYAILSIALIIFSLIGILNILRKILRKHCVSESETIVLLIPQLSDDLQHVSLETSYLISESNDPGISNACSKKSYSCYKTDTSV